MKAKAALGLLVQVAIGVAALLFGWGFDDLGGFFANPARTAFLALAAGGAVLALVLGIDVQMHRKGQRPVGRQRWLLSGLTLGMLILLWFLAYGDRRGVLVIGQAERIVRWAGFALYLAGTAVVFVALKTLGTMYSGYVTLQDEHRLVQRGIYGVIRHPIYLRLVLVSLGLPLVFRSWLFIPLFLFGVVFAGVRMRAEEKLLAEQFGEEFEAYRRRTWRLIPYLY